MKPIKGITNAQIREKFEHIQSDLQELKQRKETTNDTAFLGIFTIVSLIATIFYFMMASDILLFFIITGISCMGFFIIRMIIQDYTKE